MKKFYSWAMMLAISIAGMTFTSCNDDFWQASELNGQWEGYFGMYYDYGNYRFYSDYSVVEFYQKGFSSHGYGYEYDHYRSGPRQWEYFYFEWDIDHGDIYLHFPYNSELDCVIYDYRMTNSYFTGYFSNGSERFELRKTSNFNWNDYRYGNGYYYYGDYDYWYDGYYYSKNRNGASKNVKAVTPEEIKESDISRGRSMNRPADADSE